MAVLAFAVSLPVSQQSHTVSINIIISVVDCRVGPSASLLMDVSSRRHNLLMPGRPMEGILCNPPQSPAAFLPPMEMAILPMAVLALSMGWPLQLAVACLMPMAMTCLMRMAIWLCLQLGRA